MSDTKNSNSSTGNAVAQTVDAGAAFASTFANSGCANQAGFVHEAASAGMLTITNGEIWILSTHGHARADIVSVTGSGAQCKVLTNSAAIRKAAELINNGYYWNMDIVVPSDTYDALVAAGVDPIRLVKMPYSSDWVKMVALKMGHGYGTLGQRLAQGMGSSAVSGAAFSAAFATVACSIKVCDGSMTPTEAAGQVCKDAAIGGLTKVAYDTTMKATAFALSKLGCSAAANAVPIVGQALAVAMVVECVTDGMVSDFARDIAVGTVSVARDATDHAYDSFDKGLTKVGCGISSTLDRCGDLVNALKFWS